MIHDYHEGLPGYDPAQLLHDGCRECERRGADVEIALANLDQMTFVRAVARAERFEAGVPLNVSVAEAPLLRVLSQVVRRYDQLLEIERLHDLDAR